jgi:hypothetical protein
VHIPKPTAEEDSLRARRPKNHDVPEVMNQTELLHASPKGADFVASGGASWMISVVLAVPDRTGSHCSMRAEI